MKKQFFIIPFIACMLAISTVKAQNTPIDFFLKKYPSREGVTNVTLSQQMLQAIFAPSDNSKFTMLTSEGTSEVTVVGTGKSRKISTVTSTPEVEEIVSVVASPRLPASTSTNEKTEEVTIVKSGTSQKISTITSKPEENPNYYVAVPKQSASTTSGIMSLILNDLNQNLNVPEAYSSVSISNREIPASVCADFRRTLLDSKYESFMEINKEKSIELGYYVKKLNDSINEIVVIRQQKDLMSAIYIKGNIKIDQIDRYLSMIKSALARIVATNQTDIFPSDHQFAFATPSFNNIKDVMENAQKWTEEDVQQIMEDNCYYMEKKNYICSQF